MGDGDLTSRKRSGGPFLVKSGAIYDCDLSELEQMLERGFDVKKKVQWTFLVKSGAIYDCSQTDALLCKAETLDPLGPRLLPHKK